MSSSSVMDASESSSLESSLKRSMSSSSASLASATKKDAIPSCQLEDYDEKELAFQPQTKGGQQKVRLALQIQLNRKRDTTMTPLMTQLLLFDKTQIWCPWCLEHPVKCGFYSIFCRLNKHFTECPWCQGVSCLASGHQKTRLIRRGNICLICL
jgi:hypothetical protein